MQQVLLPLCSQCCHHPLIRPGVTYFAWLVWASAIHRAGLSPKVSAAAFATHPWMCTDNFKPLNVTSYWTTSSQPTHSMTFWSEQECLLSKKLLPPRLSLISSTFCSWFTVVKCPELVSCLCKTPFSFQWPAEKNQGGGNPFALQLNLRHGNFSSVSPLSKASLPSPRTLLWNTGVSCGCGPWDRKSVV